MPLNLKATRQEDQFNMEMNKDRITHQPALADEPH